MPSIEIDYTFSILYFILYCIYILIFTRKFSLLNRVHLSAQQSYFALKIGQKVLRKLNEMEQRDSEARSEMEKAGDAGDAVRANFFQLCFFFGFSHNFLHNFAHFCTVLLFFCAFCTLFFWGGAIFCTFMRIFAHILCANISSLKNSTDKT